MRLFLSLGLLAFALSAGKEITTLGHTPVEKPFGSRDEFTVLRDNKNWYVQNTTRDKAQRVQPAFIEPKLRSMKPYDIKNFVESGEGYISIHEFDDGSYGLSQKARARAAGPICGAIGYWGTKAIGYALPLTGIATLAYQGGEAAQEGGAPYDYDVHTPEAKSAISSTAKYAAQGTGAPVGVTQASKAAVEAGAHEAAGDMTVGMASAGLVTAYLGYVETAATAVGGALTGCWFLP